MTDPIIRTRDLCKSFGPVSVLKGINLDIQPGEVLGILGENGAGKSTLLKLISGVYTPTSGTIEIQGETFHQLDPILSRHKGIAMIPQEFNLVPTLKVYENVFLGQERRRKGLLDKAAMRAETARVLDDLKVNLNPNATIGELSVAEKQMVEVARVLVNDARVVILDEPTTVLTDREVTVLFDVVRAMQARGVAVLFISHKLKEVKSLCQRLLILRDGEQIELCDVADVSEDDMARKMVGRELYQTFPETQDHPTSVALELKNLNIPGLVRDVSLTLQHGQVLGLSGLVGSGRTEIAEALMGLRRHTREKLVINGKEPVIRSPNNAHAAGLAYLSEDRQGKGLVMNFSLTENITLLSLKKYTSGLINRSKERRQAQDFQSKLAIKAASLETPAGLLSGGNQQKVYLAKLLDIDPDILILDEPTRGIDVNTKREIYYLIRGLAEQGKAVIVISSELEEIIGLCDPVLVVREGRIAARLSGDQINEEDIMLYAAGARENATGSTEQQGITP